MKEIEALYQEILQDETLKAEFVQAAKDNQLEDFLQKNDCNATLAELQEFAEKKQRELVTLPDAELDATAGGIDKTEALSSMFTLGMWCFAKALESAAGKGVGRREGTDKLLCHGGV